jgi:hypothetical protein
MLHIYGDEHPESGLKHKVKGWHFQQNYEIMDPITKERRNVPLKPFMVNQVVYFLEQDLLTLNENDDLIWKQMENYQVVRITQTGQPVFTNEDEHTIDALMLSILAFQLEFPNLANILRDRKIARAFGEAKLVIPDPLRAIKSIHSSNEKGSGWDEPGPPPPKKVPLGYTKKTSGKYYDWGTPRGTSSYGKDPSRKMW